MGLGMKLVRDLEKLEDKLNGSGITLDTLKKLSAIGGRFSFQDPDAEASPPKKQKEALAKVPDVIRNWAEGTVNAKEVTEAVGLNPKSPSDVQRVREAMRSDPQIAFKPGNRSAYQKLLAAPGE